MKQYKTQMLTLNIATFHLLFTTACAFLHLKFSDLKNILPFPKMVLPCLQALLVCFLTERSLIYS